MTDGASAATGRSEADRQGPGPRPDAARARLLLAGLLILIVIFGARALPAPDWYRNWRGPWHDQGIAVAIGTEVALAALLGALLRLRGRHPNTSWLAGCGPG